MAMKHLLHAVGGGGARRLTIVMADGPQHKHSLQINAARVAEKHQRLERAAICIAVTLKLPVSAGDKEAAIPEAGSANSCLVRETKVKAERREIEFT